MKQRLGQPLDLDTALRVVRQVGAALEHAHSQGVLHRDVKPSNVLVGKGDWLLLSDFGLAKMAEGSLALTKTGVGVGTPEYMAPEQAEGLSYDHRVDVYALGVVLYEMVTGRVPYEAETPIAVIMKKLTAPLPLPRALNPALPEGVERVILKALSRDPADRYARVEGMVKALEVAVAEATPVEAARPAPAPAPPPVAAPPPPRETVPALPVVAWPAVPRRYLRPAALLAGLAVVLLCLGWGLLALRPKLPGLLAAFQAPTPTPVPFATATPAAKPTTPPLTVAPTATPVPWVQARIVFSQDGDIYVKNADGSGGRRLADHPAEDGFPAWSPDGRRIVFSSDRNRQRWPDGLMPHSLYIMDADGSKLTPLTYTGYADTEANDMFPSWSPDGTRIVFHRSCDLAVVKPDGSGLAILVPREPGLRCAAYPAWSKDSRRIAFSSPRPGPECPETGPCYHDFYVVNADGSGLLKLATLVSEGPMGSYIVWSPDGNQVAFAVGGDRNYVVMNSDGSGKGMGRSRCPVGEFCRSYVMNSDGSGKPVETEGIPGIYHPWYYPQWIEAVSPQVQARAFAEPILAAIANRPPDFEDDFSTADKGWKWDAGMGSQVKIADGVERVSGDLLQGHNQLWGKNFVFEVQVRLLANRGWIDPFFRDSNGRRYVFVVDGKSNSWQVLKIDEKKGLKQAISGGRDNLLPPGKANRITIIARESRFAVYLNGKPTAYFEDANFLEAGGLMLHLGVSPEEPAEGEFDNVKFWNLDKMPGLP
ncbi:MAG: protein kinase [Chloroflexota bacterium]